MEQYVKALMERGETINEIRGRVYTQATNKAKRAGKNRDEWCLAGRIASKEALQFIPPDYVPSPENMAMKKAKNAREMERYYNKTEGIVKRHCLPREDPPRRYRPKPEKPKPSPLIRFVSFLLNVLFK